MIKIDMTKKDLLEQIKAVENGILTAKSAYENIMLFQSKNRIKGVADDKN